MISQTAEYALRAVLFLGREPGTPFTTSQIAEAARLPAGYLSKVLQSLGKAGLLNSQRGLHGGFVLARSLDRVTLFDVVNAVDPLRRIDCCPLSVEGHERSLCPLHRRIDAAAATVEKTFREVTIRDLLDEETRRKILCGGDGSRPS